MTYSPRSALFALVLAIGLLPASVALAGGCPPCTSAAQCPTFQDGGVSFCVLHDAPVGCGMQLQTCCPGQGCAVQNGRPSCEMAGTCTVVGGGGTDAGSMSGTDAGSMSGTDAGTTTGMDGGTSSGLDAGTGSTGTDDGGCGCRVAGAGHTSTGAALLSALVLGLALARRRRR